MLTAELPALEYDGAETGVATLEKPIDIRVGPVSSDGAAVGPEGLATFGYFVYRRVSPGTVLDIWDDAAKVWVPEEAAASPTPTRLAYRPDDPVAVAGPDRRRGRRRTPAGQPQFAQGRRRLSAVLVSARFFVTADRSEAF